MSDASAPSQTPNLPQLIMDVSQPVWEKISTELKVKTRQEAIQLVQTDENAASIVQQIINSQTALMQGGGDSALTSSIAIQPTPALGGKAKLGI